MAMHGLYTPILDPLTVLPFQALSFVTLNDTRALLREYPTKVVFDVEEAFPVFSAFLLVGAVIQAFEWALFAFSGCRGKPTIFAVKAHRPILLFARDCVIVRISRARIRTIVIGIGIGPGVA